MRYTENKFSPTPPGVSLHPFQASAYQIHIKRLFSHHADVKSNLAPDFLLIVQTTTYRDNPEGISPDGFNGGPALS